MNRTQSIALVRALAAVSWADGTLERAEESHLVSLAYRLGLDADDLRRDVDPLLAQPVSYEQAMTIVGDLLRVLGSATDRELFLDELRQLFTADGEMSDEEEAMLTEIEEAVAGYGAVDFLIGKLRSVFYPALLPGRRQRRPPAELLPYVKNTVLGPLLDRLAAAGVHSELDPAALNRAALYGALLAYVASVGDRRIDERELAAIRQSLAEHGGLAGRELEVALAVLRQGAHTHMDRQRLCAEFNRVSTLAEREQLVGDMFAVAGAAADKRTRDEIRALASLMWIPARDFADIRGRRGGGADTEAG